MSLAPLDVGALGLDGSVVVVGVGVGPVGVSLGWAGEAINKLAMIDAETAVSDRTER